MSNGKITLSPAAIELISNVSGAYSAPFWDGLRQISGSLDTVRKIKDAIETLGECGKEIEAFNLILALYDIAAIEAPAAFFELAPYPDGIRLFVSEFILDIEDLMNDYEYEEHEAGN